MTPKLTEQQFTNLLVLQQMFMSKGHRMGQAAMNALRIISHDMFDEIIHIHQYEGNIDPWDDDDNLTAFYKHIQISE